LQDGSEVIRRGAISLCFHLYGNVDVLWQLVNAGQMALNPWISEIISLWHGSA